MFKSKYSQGPRSGFNPKTAAKPQMRASTAQGEAGSEEQAEEQIRQAQAPFQNPRGAIRGVSTVTAAMRGEKQGTHAKGTKPRHWTAAQKVSEPMSPDAIRRGAGYAKPVNYAGYKVHSQPRILRGAVKGAKQAVPAMTDEDFAATAADMKKYRIL